MILFKRILPFLIVLVGLSACDGMTQRGGKTAQPGSSEHLLQGEGQWQMVEENSGTDPAKLHSQAKKQVNPANMADKQHMPDKDLKLATNEKAANGQDVNYRLIRVERDVASLKDDFKKLLPPLSSLIVADKNLDQTIDDIAAKNMIEPASGPASPSGAMAPAADIPKATGGPMRMAGAQPVVQPATRSAAPPSPPPPQVTPAVAKAAPGSAAVSNMRFGEHPGRTRLVLDLSGPSPYKTELDNTEKLLLVQISKAGWNAKTQEKLSKHPLIAGYTAQPAADGGTTLAIELAKPVKVVSESSLPPNATYQNHRIFIDLAAI